MSFLSVLEKIHIQKNKNLKYYQRLFSDISVDIIVTPCIKLHIVSINCFVFYERFFFGVVIIKHIKFQNILKQTFLFYYHRLVSPQPASKLPKIPHKKHTTNKETNRQTHKQICKQTKHIFSHHVGTLFLIKVKKNQLLLGVQEHIYSAVPVVAIDSTEKQIVLVFHIARNL